MFSDTENKTIQLSETYFPPLPLNTALYSLLGIQILRSSHYRCIVVTLWFRCQRILSCYVEGRLHSIDHRNGRSIARLSGRGVLHASLLRFVSKTSRYTIDERRVQWQLINPMTRESSLIYRFLWEDCSPWQHKLEHILCKNCTCILRDWKASKPVVYKLYLNVCVFECQLMCVSLNALNQ